MQWKINYSNFVGDFSKSVELIKQNIQSLEYQFGSFSFEVSVQYNIRTTLPFL